MRKRVTLEVALIAMVVMLVGCGAGSSPSVYEDSVPVLDALLDKSPSAMSDKLVSSGGWQGRLAYGGRDYRVFEVMLDGKGVRLFYLPTETADGGLRLRMYDVEPFQVGQ